MVTTPEVFLDPRAAALVLTSDPIAADLSASVKQGQPIPDEDLTVQQPGRTTLLAAPPLAAPRPAVADSSHHRPATTRSNRLPNGDAPGMDAQPHPGQATRAPRVLLVDDNTGMRRVLRGLLQNAGIQVVGEAADGLEGVAQAAVLRPDVVLMDWRMPRLDGVQATARIRSQLPEIQVVVFSSAEGAGMGVIACPAGASTFVAKGASAEQVCAAVLAAWRWPPPPKPPLDST
jgi:CheY-like chemotaxis protein